MNIRRHNIIKWTISSAAFIAAMAVAAGCSVFPTSASSPSAAIPAPVAPATLSLSAGYAPADSAPITTVSELGEITAASSPQPAAVQVAGAGFQRHTSSPDGRESDVAVDPTGKWLVYSSTRHSEHADIYLQKVDGLSVIRLTDDPADEAFPTFSPDGKTIAFSSNRAGNWDIYTMDTDGKHVIQVTTGQSQDLHPTFSPDGTKLAYCSLGSRSDAWEIWVTNLATGERRIVGYGLFPTWSPDKTADRIAFQRARQRGGNLFSLWTMELSSDGEAHKLTEVAANADAAIVSPAWSPDGQHLAYISIRPSASSADSHDLWAVDADGSNRRKLTDGVGSNLAPAWSADNRVYFVSNRASAGSIWSVRAPSAIEPTAGATASAAPVSAKTESKPAEPKHDPEPRAQAKAEAPSADAGERTASVDTQDAAK